MDGKGCVLKPLSLRSFKLMESYFLEKELHVHCTATLLCLKEFSITGGGEKVKSFWSILALLIYTSSFSLINIGVIWDLHLQFTNYIWPPIFHFTLFAIVDLPPFQKQGGKPNNCGGVSIRKSFIQEVSLLTTELCKTNSVFRGNWRMNVWLVGYRKWEGVLVFKYMEVGGSNGRWDSKGVYGKNL